MSDSAALILMGGGARAAYQVGVLDGIREVLRDAGWPAHRNPFRIVCGTSAGAINAAAFASHARDFDDAITRMVEVWRGFRAGQIYRTDPGGSLLHAASWLGSLMFGWLARHAPRSLFDNSPLVDLLDRTIDYRGLRAAIADGTIESLAITASSYTSGQHVTFFESMQPVAAWSRSQRFACRAEIDTRHLMASSAIPFIFPAVSLPLAGRQEFFGDGSMRQNAPLSPAIHLGANRLLVIGAGQIEPGHVDVAHTGSQFLYPSLAQIAGHAMSSIFLDALANDIERALRVNRTLALVPAELRADTDLTPVEILAISPSKRLDTLALPHLHELPAPVRALLRVVGATERRGAGLVSYLLFEAGYTNELLALGRADALAQREEIVAFVMQGPGRVRGQAAIG